jgi:hypothetical protein
MMGAMRIRRPGLVPLTTGLAGLIMTAIATSCGGDADPHASQVERIRQAAENQPGSAYLDRHSDSILLQSIEQSCSDDFSIQERSAALVFSANFDREFFDVQEVVAGQRFIIEIGCPEHLADFDAAADDALDELDVGTESSGVES